MILLKIKKCQLANVRNRHRKANIVFLKKRWFTIDSNNYDLFIRLSADIDVEYATFEPAQATNYDHKLAGKFNHTTTTANHENVVDSLIVT